MLAELECRNTGKPIVEAEYDIADVATCFEYYGGLATKILGYVNPVPDNALDLTINTGEITYNSSYPTVGYATALTNLGGVAPCTPAQGAACLIDSVLAAGVKSGYRFAATGAG